MLRRLNFLVDMSRKWIWAGRGAEKVILVSL